MSIDTELERAAEKAGMHDPALITKLVDVTTIKTKGDGTTEGVDEAVGKLKESHAYLFKPPLIDPDKPIGPQLEIIARHEENDRITRFLATKPDDDAMLRFLRQRGLPC